MGRRSKRDCRDISGILLLDKPEGLSSNQALQQTKRLFKACKAGHTGSLDPIATGLLPLCFGEATKVSQFMLDADKRYRVSIRLGQETDTYDAEGEVVAEQPVDVTRRQLERALKAFVGEIDQIPPMYSAIKQQGQALYHLARQGVTVERQPRRVTLYSIDLLDFEGDTAVIEVDCSKGTYVRSLAHDLGQSLGCGAHVSALRRLGVGPFDISEAVSFEDLEAMDEAGREAALEPVDRALPDLAEVRISRLATPYLLQGQPVSARLGAEHGLVRLYDEDGRFLGVGEALDDGRVAPKRLMVRVDAPAAAGGKS